MRTYNNDFSISRNESFIYDRLVQNKDGSPYIISTTLEHPIVRFTISDTSYGVDTRYILNRYLHLDSKLTGLSVPKFYKTKPIRLMSGTDTYAENFNNIPGDSYNPLDIPDGVIGIDKYNYGVYYIVDENDEKIYKRYVKVSEDVSEWKDYSFRIILPFGVGVTSEWTSKNYVYGIFLMDGELYSDAIENNVINILVEEGYEKADAIQEVSTMTEEDLYNKILEYNNKDGHVTDVALIDGKEVIIDVDDPRWSPYFSVDMNIPLLNPGKITVKDDPIGGIYNE